MTDVLIPDLDEKLVAALSQEAQRKGVSLEAHLRAIIGDRKSGSRQEAIARVKILRRRVRPFGSGDPSAADLVRQLREDRAAYLADPKPEDE